MAYGGMRALEFINYALSSGIEVSSGRYGFPLIYDLLTNTVAFNLHPSDRPHNWGRIFSAFYRPVISKCSAQKCQFFASSPRILQ